MSVRLVVLLTFGLLQSRGCGFEPTMDLGPGEPCTRTSECRSDLVCSGGVCSYRSEDAGPRPRFDAGPGPGFDGGELGMDAASDADTDGSVSFDADVLDADLVDADLLDAALDAASDSGDGG